MDFCIHALLFIIFFNSSQEALKSLISEKKISEFWTAGGGIIFLCKRLINLTNWNSLIHIYVLQSKLCQIEIGNY